MPTITNGYQWIYRLNGGMRMIYFLLIKFCLWPNSKAIKTNTVPITVKTVNGSLSKRLAYISPKIGQRKSQMDAFTASDFRR